MPGLLKLKLDKIFFRSMLKEAARFEALSKDQSNWRTAQRKSNLDYPDLFSALMESCDPETGTGYTQEELISEAGLLIVAGTDTTATTATTCLFYLLHYPMSLARLQKEIRSRFHYLEDIRSGHLLNSCQYLAACLNESLRMTPPVGAILPREVLEGGMMVDGHYIPAGIDVGVPHYAIHHNPEYFPDPYVFWPERWMAESEVSQSDVARAQAAFCAFGVGRASCIGRTLAYLELSILLARIVWLYDMRLQDGSDLGEGSVKLGNGRHRKKEFQTYDAFTSTHQGPLVEFRAVKRRDGKAVAT